MANNILTPTKIAREAIMLLKNQLGVASKVHRDYIRDMYDPKSGGQVTIRKPPEYSVTTGATLNVQDSTEYSVVIPAPTQKHVAMRFSSQELTLEIEDFSKRHIAPAITQLGNDLEYDILGLYNQIPHCVGSPGTTPNDYDLFGAAAQRMDELGVESDNRCFAINPATKRKMTNALKGLFNPNMTEDMVRRGELGNLAGFGDVFMSQNVRTHTTGTYSTGSTPVVNGATAEGATTIVTDGWANSTAVLKAGDVFTIDDVYEVNPRNKQSTGVLKQFVAQSDVTSDSSGNATITIMDSTGAGLRSTGPFQNCSAMPANNAGINVWAADGGLSAAGAEGTTYPMNLAFHKNALALVFFNIETPSSAKGTTVSDPDSGISIRLIQDYDIVNDREVYRLDILRSLKVLDPNRAVRLVG